MGVRSVVCLALSSWRTYRVDQSLSVVGYAYLSWSETFILSPLLSESVVACPLHSIGTLDLFDTDGKLVSITKLRLSLDDTV